MKLLNEKNFPEEMKNFVEPCFDAWGRESWYAREKGREIFCLSLHQKEARGVVLISHGFCESGEKYKELAWYFYQAGFSVYIPEHCGHGRSYRLTKDPCKVHIDSFWRYVKDLSYVAEKVREENPGLPLLLFGHSMGGAIAAVTLAENPGKFQKGILNAPMILHRTGNIPPMIAYGASFLMCSLDGEKTMPWDSMDSGMMKPLRIAPAFPEQDLIIIMRKDGVFLNFRTMEPVISGDWRLTG